MVRIVAYGGVLVWPFSLLPQHVACPVGVRAQLWKAPAVVLVWRPVGALVCLMVLLPQHRMVPLVARAQVCCHPAAIAV